jgi:hypothetical protein
MSVNRRSIFRDRALKHYTQNKKRDILPNFSSISSAVFFWALLGLLAATGLLAWYTPVSLYTTGTGIVVQAAKSSGVSVVVFFSPADAAKLHPGQSVHLGVGATGQQLESTLTEIQPGTATPAEVLRSYGLQINNPALNQPEVVTLVNLGNASPDSAYAGSIVSAQVEVGTQSLLSSIISIK